MPVSGPPDPDTTERLNAILEALRAGADPGVQLSDSTRRAMLSALPPVHDALQVGGVRHQLYEINGIAYLAIPA